DDERRSVWWTRAMADFCDFERAEQLAASLRDPTMRSAAWAAIAESALAAGVLDVAEHALAAVEDTAFQRRPQLDLVHALAAMGDITRAAGVARGAADPKHRAAALLLAAHETRSEALFDEVTQLADTVADPDIRLAILVTALEYAAKARLR